MVEEVNMNSFGKNQPEKRFSAGGIQATVWKNKVKDSEDTYQTVSVQRCYKDKEGNWKHTDSLRVTDIPKANLVLQKAYEYIVLKKEE